MQRFRPHLLLTLAPLVLPAPARELAEDDGPAPLHIHHAVKGQVMIIFLKPDGAAVKKGELTSELDSADLRDQLFGQEIKVKMNAAQAEFATKSREVAVLGKSDVLNENESKLNALRLEVKFAENGRTYARTNQRDAEQAGRSERFIRNFQIAVLEAENTFDDASQKLDIFTRFSVPASVAKAELAIKRAESVELGRKADLEKARAKVSDLRNQIVSCRISAPVDGTVHHLRDRDGKLLGIREGGISRGDQDTLLLKPIVPEEKPKAEAPAPDEQAIAKELERFKGKWVAILSGWCDAPGIRPALFVIRDLTPHRLPASSAREMTKRSHHSHPDRTAQ